MNDVERYARDVSRLHSYSQSETLVVDTIVNPAAGFFRRRRTLQRIIVDLEHQISRLRNDYPERKVEINRVHFTEYSGHARIIAEQIVQDEARRGSESGRLIVAAGGDGTSNEICSTLYQAEESIAERIRLIRFPLGTGNDNTDAQSFEEAYRLILGNQESVRAGALRITVGGGRSFYAFNIASVGLDAYIAALTNFFKRIVPGDAYKLMVDIGTLFYESRYRPGEIDVTLTKGGNQVERVHRSATLIAVGVSGRRTYGGGMRVLPGEANVCLIDAMGLFKKLRSKGLLFAGEHGTMEETHFYQADKVHIEYSAGCLPMQTDGEQVVLNPQHFPVCMEVLKPKINVVRE